MKCLVSLTMFRKNGGPIVTLSEVMESPDLQSLISLVVPQANEEEFESLIIVRVSEDFEDA